MKRGLSALGGGADTANSARGEAVDIPVGMDADAASGLHPGLVPLETATSSQSQALPLPASVARDVTISATVVLDSN